MGLMSAPDETAAAPGVAALCHFPGCSKPRRPDPATGRPTKYCEEVVDGVIHNRVNAWHRRRANPGSPADAAQPNASPSVSMARLTLEERLTQLPGQLVRLVDFLGEVVTEVQSAGDLSAAGAEVQDAHREALAKVSEAEARSGAAERAQREAQARADAAEIEKAEADAAAEAAVDELAQVRADYEAQLERVRAEAAVQVAAAQNEAGEAQRAATAAAVRHDEQLRGAGESVAEAQRATAAADAMRDAALESAERERGMVAELRAENEQLRQDVVASRAQISEEHAARRLAEAARDSGVRAVENVERDRDRLLAEREATHREHTEALQQLRRDADERAAALTAALEMARETAAAYQRQLPGSRDSVPPSPRKAVSSRRTIKQPKDGE